MDKRQRPISLQTTSQGTPGMSTFYDALETRSPAEREAALMAALPQQIAHRQKAGRATNVFGGFGALGFGGAMPCVFASPGTLYDPGGTRGDYWRLARAI